MAAAKARPASQRKPSGNASESKQIESFLAKYSPEMVTAGKQSRAKMRQRVPGGVEFVYDNYNALVFGYGPTERPSEAVLSLAMMPQWVTLCLLKGAKLPDPKNMLRGSGNVVRNIRLTSPAHLDDPDVENFIQQSIAAASPAFPREGGEPRTVIKSISAKQRPRRPR
ncbi:MAG: hypothetical protein DMD63_13480 [Gemmatimonadetes bacterium]|nr:MAG: hypothetical protein DMD63_13480 [Gemmatimonadota bacterium]